MKKIRVGLYVRVSTQEQARDGYSIDEQKERLGKYAEAHSWIVYKIYSDPGFSGAKIERPSLKEMIEDVKTGKLDKILVYKLDRLSRSQKDTLYLIEDVFLDNNVDFVSMTENFDTSTPFGKAMIGILSVFAQLEREQIKERMSLGREGRAKSGLFHGSTKVPIGYRYDNGLLIVDPYESEIIRRIFTEFGSGRSVYSIAKDLKEEGVTSSYGSFSRNTIQSILKNNTYLGLIKFNDQIFDGQHDAIITEDLFKKAEERFRIGREKDLGYNFTHKTQLASGLCYCGNCGRKMRYNYGAKRVDGSRARYISCPDKTRSGCNNPNIHAEPLDDYLIDQIRKLRLDPEYFRSVRSGSDPEDHKAEIKTYEDRIKTNKGKISKLMDLYSIGGIDFTDIAEKIQTLNAEVSSLERKILRIRESDPGKTEEELQEIIYSLEDYIKENDQERIRIVVETLVKRIEIKDKTVKIYWSF